MKQIIIAIIVGLLLISCGAQNDEVTGNENDLSEAPLLTLTPGDYIVDVVDYTIQPERNAVVLDLEAAYPNGQTHERQLTILYTKSVESWDYHGKTILSDNQGEEIFSFQFEWNTETNRAVRITERAEVDYLQVERRTIDNKGKKLIIEDYNINGAEHEVRYEAESQEQIHAMWDQYNTDGLSKQLTETAIGQEIAAFDTYYNRQAALNNNPNGDLLALFSFNDELGEWLSITTSGSIGFEKPQRAACFLAVQCTLFKCFAGGAGNAVCVTCAVGAAIICNV
ncbi:MAG: hypothetical protein K9N46_11920 [Candidatus Marinimicrobia bacterium]|nr:hypothetical protein [Candidatus Neomarinimicrobiota bacterium]MCF7827331.1 hypothetical protein [Candidatus Neomarinimicrobiota bacterium]MCF7881436.1 hypothetical protein [Candidatus Neomarinimicrobiota bacterium]